MMRPLNQYIEHTNLNPTIDGRQVDQLILDALKWDFLGVCLPPFWVKRAKRELGSSPIHLVTVIGFPLGYNMTETKIEEMERAMDNGADELDLVMNVSAFKDGMPWPKIEIAKCAKMAHEREKLLKVIIETAYLSDREIREAAQLVADAGGDFVKTSTGFAPEGAREAHVRLLRDILPSQVGIKASGGIRNATEAKAMIAAGADRIGTSRGPEIMGVE